VGIGTGIVGGIGGSNSFFETGGFVVEPLSSLVNSFQL
jgi:hypothetical protein